MVNPHRRSHLSPSLAAAPEPIKALFRGVEVYDGLDSDDLREMGKFGETTNIQGLPVHPIVRPHAGGVVREFGEALADLPKDLLRRLRGAIGHEPSILVRGSLAGACRDPLSVVALFPQSEAHLAQALQTCLWPGRREVDSPVADDLYLIQVPDFDEQMILSVPTARAVLVLGTDELHGGMLVALEWANRRWTPGAEKNPSQNSPIRILAGGSFVFDSGTTEAGKSSGPVLVFTGESVPDSWEDALVTQIPSLAGRPGIEPLLGGGEPWVAQEGGWLCSLWYAPPLAAVALAGSPAWEAAALHPAALPFGVRVNEAGALDLAGSSEEAYVIVPRRAMPPPFPCSAAPVKVTRVLTHRHSKEEAMDLWALGFPHPEII